MRLQHAAQTHSRSPDHRLSLPAQPTTTRRRHDEVGTSWPLNKIASGHTTRPDALMKSREREPTEDAFRPSCNVFDRLGRNKDEDMRTHLEARRNSVTSRRREDLSIIPLITEKINELRARLEKLVARNTEAAPWTSTLPFSAEIQQAPLPVGFKMQTMATYKGKIDPQDDLDVFNDQINLLQVITLAHCRCFAVTLSGTTKKWIR